MYEEITRYANSIRTMDENAATAAAKGLGDMLVATSLFDSDYYNTLASRGIEDPWLADAESIDGETVIAILSKIKESDFWCDGGWRSTIQSGYLNRLIDRLEAIDEATARQTSEQEEAAVMTA